MKRPLRLMFVSGPGDVAGTYHHWREGRDDPSQVNVAYSRQFFDVCREVGAQGHVIAFHPRRTRLIDKDFSIYHQAPPFAHSRSALLYYCGQFWSTAHVMFHAIRCRADVLVHAGGTSLWFMLRLLPIFNVAVVPSLHCVLWRKSERAPGRAQRWIRGRDRLFWRRSASAILSISSDVSNQVVGLTGSDHAPIIEFLPTYRPGTFHPDPPPADRANTFRVLFAGRIEPNKGALDLLEIARRLAKAGRTEIEFDVCGEGSVLAQLRDEVAGSGMSSRFRVHGCLDRDVMREMLRNCHAVIVPTTTDFIEGFNKVVAEGILAGRPVITSTVCPAIEYVREAVVEVPPDDIAAYEAAILELYSNRELYDAKRSACASLQAQFYDYSRSWAAAFRRVLESIEASNRSLPASTDREVSSVRL
jgi:glycogen synthase